MTKDEEIAKLEEMVYAAIGHYMDGWFAHPDLDVEFASLKEEVGWRDE